MLRYQLWVNGSAYLAKLCILGVVRDPAETDFIFLIDGGARQCVASLLRISASQMQPQSSFQRAFGAPSVAFCQQSHPQMVTIARPPRIFPDAILECRHSIIVISF